MIIYNKKEGAMEDLRFSDGTKFFFSKAKNRAGVMYSPHRHAEFEFYYLVSGKCNYFIEDKTYEVSPGDVVLIPEEMIHRTNYATEKNSRILIECSSAFIPEGARERLKGLYHVYRNEEISPVIAEVLRDIEAECKSGDEFTENALKCKMNLLIYLLLRNKNTIGRVSGKNAMIEEIVAYVKEYFREEITLSSIAKARFLSPEHLSRTFKKETGFGFNEYLTLIRLRHAEGRLKERDGASISEIAYDSGFNDSNYFSDKFKRVYGVSPLKYSREFEVK